MTRRRAVVVIDGEHYPPVVRDCVAGLGERFEVAAAAFVGGREKLRREAGELGEEYGVPLLRTVEPGGEVAATANAVAALVAETGAEVFVDLSDEPVLGYRERFVLASAALAAGCVYEGSDFALSPPPREPFALPSLAVIGTGKRVGKTAIAGHLARVLDRRLGAEGGVVIVAMGRGGPPEPEVVRGDGVDAQALLEASRRGRHAASDCYEDAVLAGVTTVGCRRCGGGLAGAAYESSVAAALPLVEELAPALAVFEGSGAVVPPVLADGVVCVAGAHQPPDYVTGYLGTYRLLLSDVLVLTMCEAPFASREAVRRLRDAALGVRPGLEVVTTVFRPRPATPVRGRRVAFFSTAPPEALPLMTRHLEEAHGAEVVLASGALADRRLLVADVERAVRAAEVFLTEIKAAAIDVVAEAAAAAGLELAFCDNEPVAEGGVLDAALDHLGARCLARHEPACHEDARHGERPT